MEIVVNFLVANKVIEKERTAVYLYGLNQLVFLALHLLTYALLAYFFGEMKQLFVFLVLFIPLRIYAGGYHAKTRIQCFVISVTMVLSVLFMFRYAKYDLLFWIVLFLLSYGVVFLLSPRESINKPLCAIEKKVYRRRSLVLLNGESLLCCLSLYFGNYEQFACVVLALLYVSLLLIEDWIFERVDLQGIRP